MCGLVGVISFKKSGLFKPDVDRFYDMLIINSLRGMHSTGVFGVHENENKVDWAKVVGSPYVAFSETPFKDIIEKATMRYNVLVGHGRYATKGDIVAPNAHPFEVGDITLVHNGNVTNGHKLTDYYDFPVDSQYLAWSIANKGIEETYKEVQGAMAVIYHNKGDNSIYAFRNNDRPLWLLEVPNELIYLSSEEATLQWIKVKYNLDEKINPKYLIPDMLYQFKTDSFGWESTKLEPYVPPVVYLPPHSIGYVKKVIPTTLPKTGRRHRILHTHKIGNYLYRVGDDIKFLSVDINTIYNKEGKAIRHILSGEHPEDGALVDDPTIAATEIISNVDASVFTEEELYSCDYLIGKILRMYRTKEDKIAKVVVTIQAVAHYKQVDKEKHAQLLLQDNMCSQCNTHISMEDESKLVSEGGNFVLCKACSGG